MFTRDRALTIIDPTANGQVLILWAEIGDHFGQRVLLAFRAGRPNKNGTIGIEFRATLETKVAIGVGLASFASYILFASGP